MQFDQSSSSGWHQRYLAGEMVSVWKEISPHHLLELDDARRLDAEAVLKETSARIVHDVELIADRLVSLGYKPFATLYVPADTRSRENAVALNKLLDIPHSLRAFYDSVKEINFMGDLEGLSFHLEPDSPDPRYSEIKSDPIVVGSAASVIREIEDGVEDGEFTVPPSEQIVLSLSPDTCHKHGYSGGDPLGILVPNARIDGTWNDPSMMFIDYLRFSLVSWGGFPGLRHMAVAPPVLKYLCEGLVAF